MNEKDSVYIRLGRRFQRIPADMRGWYLLFVNGELYLSREHSGLPKPVGVVVDQIGTTLVVAEYEVSGPMTFEEAMVPKDLAFGYIKPHCELPSRCELLQMYKQKDKFPESIAWLWSKEEYSSCFPYGLSWYNGSIFNTSHNAENNVRRVFRISIKSLFV
jgi:hypothetical protein